MGSLRFPFWFSRPAKNTRPFHVTSSGATVKALAAAAVTAGAGAAAAAGIAVIHDRAKPRHPFVQNAIDLLLLANHSLPLWASLSLADNSAQIEEPKTGVSFPSVLGGTRQLLGVGLRKKSILGLKNIDVYAFGVYVDDEDIKSLLNEKYGNIPTTDIKGKNINDDLMDADAQMTVRLSIVYSKLSIRSVRSAFEDSVGSRLQKFGGSENKELLQKFTSQFKDEYKIPSGSVIDLCREKGYILRTTINGEEVGSIQSKLLCRSIFDLYVGEDPFDKRAKEDIELKLASILQK